MPHDFTIKTASLLDLGDLRRLEAEAFTLDSWPLIDLIGVLSFPSVVRLKAVAADGRMLGFIAGDERSGGLGWITTIAVFQFAQGHGIASALLGECERRMKVSRLRLSVRRSNRGAIALYEKHGYYLLEVWPGYYNGGEDALVMEKKI